MSHVLTIIGLVSVLVGLYWKIGHAKASRCCSCDVLLGHPKGDPKRKLRIKMPALKTFGYIYEYLDHCQEKRTLNGIATCETQDCQQSLQSFVGMIC